MWLKLPPKPIRAYDAGSKDACGLEAMFLAAVAGQDIPSEVPHERWSIERAYAPEVAVDKMYVRHAGFLSGVQEFDAATFRCAIHILRLHLRPH